MKLFLKVRLKQESVEKIYYHTGYAVMLESRVANKMKKSRQLAQAAIFVRRH